MAKRQRPHYLGIKSLAQVYWCHQFFIFHANKHEHEYQGLAEELKKLPGHLRRYSNEEAVQLTGSHLQRMSLADVNQKLATVGLKLGPIVNNSIEVGMRTSLPILPILPQQIMVGLYPINAPVEDISSEEFQLWKQECQGRTFVIFEDGQCMETKEITEQEIETKLRAEGLTNAMIAGIKSESKFAEKYDGAQALFTYGDYSIVGAPDGISTEFCYEFKNTRTSFLSKFIRPIAIAQANLYSYFLQKPKIRIQIRVEETEEIITVDQPTDAKAAEELLEKADKLLSGKMPPIPPKAWKCKHCEFKEECPTAQV